MRQETSPTLIRSSERPPRGTRQAMTRVEVMAVVTLTSIMMGVVISLFIGLLRRNQDVCDRSVRSEQLTQLAETIRTDIRRGLAVSLPARNTLEITLPGEGRTRYEFGPDSCRRIVEAPGEAGPHSEIFLIGPAASWTLERGPQGRYPLILVALERTAAENDAKPGFVPLVVCGALGADISAPSDSATGDASEPL